MKNFEGTFEKQIKEWLGDLADNFTLDQIVEIRAQTYTFYSNLAKDFGEERAKQYGIKQVAIDVAEMFLTCMEDEQ